MKSAVCPSCDADIEIGAMPCYGLRLECPVCDAALKIIWLDPVELDWWDYEDDEDDKDVTSPEEDEDDLSDFEERAYISIIDNLDEGDLDQDDLDQDDLENPASPTFKAIYNNGISDGAIPDSAEDYFEDRELLDK
jgi:hypothetical protein